MLELTHHCNFRCAHCYLPSWTSDRAFDTNRTLALLEELVEIGTLNLTLSGGEPLLCNDFFDIVSKARDLGFNVRVQSNGALIDGEVARKFREFSLAAQVSFYTVDQERFDDLAGHQGAFLKVKSGLENLRSHKVPTTLMVPRMTVNHGMMTDIRCYAQKLGATVRIAANISPRLDGSKDPLKLRLPVVTSASQEMNTIARSETSDHQPRCGAARSVCVVEATGRLRPCGILPAQPGDLSIIDHSFREVWEKSIWLARVRNLSMEDLTICRTCKVRESCKRCHAIALLEGGDILGIDPRACLLLDQPTSEG